MKTRVILTLCVVFVWGLVSIANAQVIAGSPEDKAFQKIDAENNIDAKIVLLQDFEKQFAQSKSVREAYLQLIQIYQQKNDQAKIIDDLGLIVLLLVDLNQLQVGFPYGLGLRELLLEIL